MLPPVNLRPPFNISRSSHVRLNVADLAESRNFYMNVLGLVVTEEDDSTCYLRGLAGGVPPQPRARAVEGRRDLPTDRVPGVLRRGPRRRLPLLPGSRPARRLGGRPAPGPDAARERSDRHADRALRDHGDAAAAAHRLRGVPGRPRPAARPLPGPRAGHLRSCASSTARSASATPSTSRTATSCSVRSCTARAPASTWPSSPARARGCTTSPTPSRKAATSSPPATSRDPRLRRRRRARSRAARPGRHAVRLPARPRRAPRGGVQQPLPDHRHRDRAGALGRGVGEHQRPLGSSGPRAVVLRGLALRRASPASSRRPAEPDDAREVPARATARTARTENRRSHGQSPLPHS